MHPELHATFMAGIEFCLTICPALLILMSPLTNADKIILDLSLHTEFTISEINGFLLYMFTHSFISKQIWSPCQAKVLLPECASELHKVAKQQFSEPFLSVLLCWSRAQIFQYTVLPAEKLLIRGLDTADWMLGGEAGTVGSWRQNSHWSQRFWARKHTTSSSSTNTMS